MKPDLKPIDFN